MGKETITTYHITDNGVFDSAGNLIGEPYIYGKIAYAANREAWPPADSYVEWEKLSNQAKAGWNMVSAAVINAWRSNNP